MNNKPRYVGEDGFRLRSPNSCRNCTKAYSREYVRLNPDKFLAKKVLINRRCPKCLIDYEVLSSSNRKFCSTDCARLDTNARRMLRKAKKRPPKPKPVLKCIEYPGEYPCRQCLKPTLLKQRTNKYCSKKCKRRAERTRNQKSNSVHPRNKTKKHNAYSYLRKRVDNPKNRIPKWQDRVTLNHIFSNCPDGFVVDHIIPLNNPLVSGLHCTANLQILSTIDNTIKSNKFDGSYNNDSWRAQTPNKLFTPEFKQL